MAINILDPALRFNSNHSDRVGAPKGIVLHHSAAEGSVESVHAYHKNQNGWAGIGYHFYIRRDGTIYRGRPEQWMGAHTTGYNDMFGVCAEGHFDNETMSAVQQAAVAALVRDLKDRYGDLTVYAHRDLDATSCPGNHFPLAAIVGDGEMPQDEMVILAFQQAALADDVALPKYGADGVWGPETASAATAIVQYGNTGERVRLIQSLLLGLGYDLGRGGTDGIFGDKTEAAVKAFQAKHSLAVDGLVGINTWMVLLGVT